MFCTVYGLNAAQETFIGGYGGELSDRGERVALERPPDSDDPLNPLNPLDCSWVVVDELFYFDRAPWPVNADGSGYPLIRADVSGWISPSANDSDGDQMSDDGELYHFQSLEQAVDDRDDDGFSNLAEYIADTDPSNSASYFVIEELQTTTLQWTPAAGRTYSIYWTDDMRTVFTRIASGLPDTQTSFTDTQHPGDQSGYYRISVELNE